MSASVSIDFEGLEEVLSKLRNWPPGMRKAVARAIGRGLQMIANVAKTYAPVDMGQYRGSIGAKTAFGINEVKHIGSDVVGRVGTRSEYGPYIEWGRRPGRRMPPVSIIEEWAARHGMAGLGFVIARSIGRRGLKGKRVLERAMQDQTKNVIQHIEKAIVKAGRRF